jgi:hypothetical protein
LQLDSVAEYRLEIDGIPLEIRPQVELNDEEKKLLGIT